ncbi:hypothetical protein [Streptomyces sp. NPDC087538]|uniref:hypothetical protein n=1 Tax=Streptomyces sp. NPDC087538 TaxID=3365797 RepID=UPI0037FB125A
MAVSSSRLSWSMRVDARSRSPAVRISFSSVSAAATPVSASISLSTAVSSLVSVFPARASAAHLFRSRAAMRVASCASETASCIRSTA